MVYIVTKMINGLEYSYLVASMREGAHVRQKTIKYIGPKRLISPEEFECMCWSYERKDWVLQKYADELPYTAHNELKTASANYCKYVRSLDNVSREKEREKFLSKFIASSNAIEGSTLTAKETFEFLFKDTIPSRHSKKELFMATNLLAAWRFVEAHKHRLPTREDLCALHSLVNRDIEEPITLGKYKRVQNYIGDVLTTSHLWVDERMDEWLRWIRGAFRRLDNFEIAFQSHAQFEIIHPFVDGNGRVGRLVLNWLLLYKSLAPCGIDVRRREEYIIALENSRRGKVEAICVFLCNEYLQQHKFL